ncbi:hypothetical protein THTE_3263 [Thermogutta terrifontis]|uniref:Uncharacterized protein n=1 Tax=Thermogutta terrifontis TaxID=1331910 RepID=A0A286RIR8_9BACT|nr:hypothetical protein [Thermogutta terrifontis]ASV75865.1 hypothetical protein THTE_3263 [Thermogutta terrifontis]
MTPKNIKIATVSGFVVCAIGLVFSAGCCATCYHRSGPLVGMARPGAVYPEEEPGVYHSGPLAGLFHLLGIGRGYPCDGCGPRYWGDWGGERAGCEACDEYGQWIGPPVHHPVARPRALEQPPCEECQKTNQPEVVPPAPAQD